MTTQIPEFLKSEYPFDSRFIELGGARYHYIDEGNGSPVLFVHGNPTWSFAWRKLLTAVSPTHRALAVDHIGMGLSDKPANYSYTLKQHVDNLVEFIERLDLRGITLVGHDWGGCIGMGAAVARPDRFKRFVMMNTAAFRSTRIPLRIAVCRIPILGGLGVRGLNLFSRAALTMASNVPGRMTKNVCQGYLLPYDSWAHRVAVHRFVQDIPLNESHPSYGTLKHIEEGLAQFRNHPIMFLWGVKDWCFSTAFLDEWIDRFPVSRVVRFPEAGHYLFEDVPEKIIPELQKFLSH